MKSRLLALLLAAAMLLALTACGGDGGAASSAKASSKAASKTASASVSDAPAASEVAASSQATASEAPSGPVADSVAFRDAAADKAVKNLKILPVGDSLTYGIGVLSGWRYAAFRQFYAAGITFEFVGPYQSKWDTRVPARYQFHGGKSGWKMSDVLANEQALFDRDFDVVCMMIGYNDKSNAASAEGKQSYRDILDKIFSHQPNATVFCMGVAPDYSGWKTGHKAFNDFISSLCTEYTGKGKAVYYVDTCDNDNWDKVACFNDSVHFNEAGNACIAECLAKVAVPVLKKLNVADSSYSVPAAPTSVKLDKTALTLTSYGKYGEGAQLTATVAPENAEIKNVVWGSSDRRVATVDENGAVRAQGAGTCTVTAYTLDGGKAASCKVTVKAGGTATVLYETNFASAADWEGKPTVNFSIGKYHSTGGTDNVLSTKAAFDAGSRFYLGFKGHCYTGSSEAGTASKTGYTMLRYGGLEVREGAIGRNCEVWMNGQLILQDKRTLWSFAIAEYGVVYDNGKVTLLRDGVPLAQTTVSAKPKANSKLELIDNEHMNTNLYSASLIKF